ncbi:transcriptional regulator [Kutzneria buriramensis]|uniref:Uncharacterized protein n=1 Tax=Kutzneria buriramensis TaxID=1045776 RepID=A0A3E0HL34_9PSEU|nr:transcriptional regulator [Kutzneria buriramensis]REH47050.1 hypothetical protein BCF44_106214 [Kutzneria buriramensis]
MDSVSWTGETACALQAALQMSNDAFAAHLGIGVRTVADWHQKPSTKPQTGMQQVLDTALENAKPAAKVRFAQLTAGPSTAPSGAEQRLTADPNIVAGLDWLDHHAGWEPGTARARVAARLSRVDIQALRDRGSRRARVDQRRIADALADYYGTRTAPYGTYSATYDDSVATTSILTQPDWLDLACPLVAANDRLSVVRTAEDATTSLTEDATDRAIQRLAETLAMGTRLVDMPLYRLLDIDVRKGRIGGQTGVSRFVGYAVTMDLLENELVDALASDTPLHGSLPLRDRYLPDLASVLNVSDRLCAGGTLALLAIARPASPFRGDADYVLLVQERSGYVLNAARRLAVIPKGFHQPINDIRADAQIGATLRREMEEELFGRDDIDNTVSDDRRADPMHPSRLSEPMRWLMDEPGRLRMECTGFGLNLVSGNFEFPSLIVIEDEEFWTRYGGIIEANWESSNLHQYSSLDPQLLTELISDVAWSNEGLFALLQGLRRLAEIGGSRVDMPTIEWKVQ